MSRLEKYSSYKDSGVEWLGEIPEHWEVNKLKYISNVYNGATPSSGTERFWNGNISWVTPTDFNKSNYINQTERKITKSGLNSCGTTLVPKNSIIMTTRAPIGNIAIAENELCTNQGCKSIVINKKTDEKYMFYQFSTKSELLNSLGSGTTFMELSSKELKNIKIPLPPQEEQTKIASFLDEKTAQIDEVISQKEKLIELLKERRQIVINDAVTKGLDKNIEFLDSGVEWIGEIPKGWEVFPGLRVFSENKRKNTGMIDDRVLSLSYGRIVRKPKEKLVGLVPESFETYQIVKAGDIIIRCTDLQNDKVSLRTALAKDDGIITSAYLNLNVKDGNSEYLHYLLHVLDITKAIYKLGSGLRQNLSFVDFKRLDIVLPPKHEQLQIVKHIDDQTTKIDKAIDLQQNYIAKLKEYKSSLIDSVVTGKVRVV
jgi:type I restriction enzyme S subunit